MIITVTAYKRPELLKRCLESILSASLPRNSTVKIIVSCDWHSVEMSQSMILNIPIRPDIRPIIHQKRLGVANHPRWLFNWCTNEFKYKKHRTIVALEEDTIVSPDCFLFADWALRQKGYQFVNLAHLENVSWSHTPAYAPFEIADSRVHEDRELRSPYGWAFTTEFWRELEPQWNGKIRSPYGWDWQLSHLCYREKWRCLTPEVPRVYNTGRENGTYDTPANWGATQRDVVICQVVPNKYGLYKHSNLDSLPIPEWVQEEMRL